MSKVAFYIVGSVLLFAVVAALFSIRKNSSINDLKRKIEKLRDDIEVPFRRQSFERVPSCRFDFFRDLTLAKYFLHRALKASYRCEDLVSSISDIISTITIEHTQEEFVSFLRNLERSLFVPKLQRLLSAIQEWETTQPLWRSYLFWTNATSAGGNPIPHLQKAISHLMEAVYLTSILPTLVEEPESPQIRIPPQAAHVRQQQMYVDKNDREAALRKLEDVPPIRNKIITTCAICLIDFPPSSPTQPDGVNLSRNYSTIEGRILKFGFL